MVTKIKPYNPSASQLVSDWHVLDARDKVLGRIASEAAVLLMGKHRPEYVPHLLSGDFVVIVNAADVKVTGNKADQIVYKRHSQKPGKLKELPYRRVQEKFPGRIIEHAVRGMLPKNKLGERMIRRLKVYAGEEHPHVSQVTWTESRPERDAVAAAEAEEAAKKRVEARERTAARREIAAEAAAKTDTVETPSEKPAVEKKPDARATEAPEAAAVEAVAEPEAAIPEEAAVATKKKTPAKKPAARRTPASKTATAKPGESTTKPKRASSGPAKPTAAKTTASKSKAPTTKSADSSETKSTTTRTTRKKPAKAKNDE